MQRTLLAQQDEKKKARLAASHEAMMKRLERVPNDSALVERAIRRDARESASSDKRQEQWDLVEELVSGVSSEFIDGEVTFKEAISKLLVSLHELS